LGNIGCSKKSTKNVLINQSWDKQSGIVTFGLSQVFVTHERKKERKKDSERKKELLIFKRVWPQD